MTIFVDFHEKVGRADVKRLKGVQGCQRHCLPIATCLLTTPNDLLVSVQKRQGKAREREESDKLCKLAPSVLHLNPSLQNDTARISARACGTDPAWNRRTGAAFHYLRWGLVIIQPIIPM